LYTTTKLGSIKIIRGVSHGNMRQIWRVRKFSLEKVLLLCSQDVPNTGYFLNSKLVFRSNTGNSTDYHSQMNSEVFKSWFTQMLNSLEEPSLVVMYNALYHSTLIDNFPKSNTRKADVQDWLTKKKNQFFTIKDAS